MIDLTPFGFTPTENLAYVALLNSGPSTGYALAKALSIARANAYQALNGLVAKQAALRVGDPPQRFRAIRPDAILALLVDEESRKMDRLESQIATVHRDEDATVAIQGFRGLTNIALRQCARETGVVQCLGPADFVEALAPVWRRRLADGRASMVWALGREPNSLPVELAGTIDEDRVRVLFGSLAIIVLVGATAIAATVTDAETSGYWTTHATSVGLARGCLELLTARGWE